MTQRPATPPGCDCTTLLALWERGLGQSDWTRGDALLQLAGDAAPPRTLGERTVRLLKLHASLFGRKVALRSHCPACGAVAEFSSDCHALAEQLPPPDAQLAHRLDMEGVAIEFRLPDSADVAAASSAETEAAFVHGLLDRCVLACTSEGASMPVRELPDAVLDALSRRMEALDPGAMVSFALECPACAAAWNAPLDVAQLVWQKVQMAAERLLLDVDALARAYGWTERDVLDLSPVRRAAYLQLVSA